MRTDRPPRATARRGSAALILLGLPTLVAAQGCTELGIPMNDFDLPNRGAAITDDGSRIVLSGRLDTTAATSTREIFLFNPQAGTFTQLTRNTPPGTDLTGAVDLAPVLPTAITRDGSKVFISGSARSSFPFFAPPGRPAAQYEEIIGTPGRVEILDVASGNRTGVGLLTSEPLAQNEVYTATISAVSSDGTRVFLNEAVNVVSRFTLNGRQRNVVDSKRRVAGGILDLRTLQYDDVAARIFTLVGTPGAFPFGSAGVSFLMSGDGNAVAFDSGRRLEAAGGPFWTQVAGNTAAVQTAPYVYYRDRDVVEPIVQINFGAARTVASSFNFVRNIGQTGTVFGIDRGASYVGAPLNVSGANSPAVVRVGSPPTYVIGPPATLPARGQFVNTGTYISRNEQRLYFTSADDLVTGQNTVRSQELFAYEIATRQLRQVSNLQDGLTAAFAADPQTLQVVGDDRQISFIDASADGRTVIFLVGGTVQVASTRRLPNGRINVVFPTAGSAELPASQFYRLARCN